jgi:hypothetical protein
MTIAAALGAAIFFAFFIERGIEKFVSDPKIRNQAWLVLLAIALGILVAVGFNIDLVTIFLNTINGGSGFATVVPYLGHVITGVAIGFGSTFIHDVFDSGK